MHALMNISLRAARDGAGVLAQQFDRLDRVKIVDDKGPELLTSTGLDAEKSILYQLQKMHPEHSYSTRGAGLIEGENQEVVWLIEPLVGSRNFIRGVPHFALSIACQIGGKTQHAVLINPLLNEEFIASRGQGANLGSQRMRVTSSTNLIDNLIALDSPASADLDDYTLLQQKLVSAGAIINITGCGALDVVYAAAGRYAGGITRYSGTNPLAAALLILKESGGLAADTQGNPDLTNARSVVFGNSACFKQMLPMLK